MAHKLLLIAFASILCASRLLGCSCVGIQPYCNSLPLHENARTAIFVGKVSSVYPAESMQDYARLLTTSANGTGAPNPDLVKEGLLKIWRGVLTPEEEAHIRSAKPADLPMPLSGMFWTMPRRIQLDVGERFQGATGDHFELFTGIGGGDCGVAFKTGETFLVVASQDPATGRWSSTICSRTQSIRYADSDLRALRAWKEGRSLKPRVYGNVEDWTNRGKGWGVESKPLGSLKLELRTGDQVRTTLTGADGSFAFDDLEPKVYQLRAEIAGWRFLRTSESRTQVDLTHAGCSELFLTLEQLQGEVHGTLVIDKQAEPAVLWIEALPVDPKSGLKSRTGGTKERGGSSFTIDAIEPGDYVIAIDVENPPTTVRGRSSQYERITPYPPLYFPGTEDRSRAQAVHLERGQTLQLPPWNLPPPSPEREIHAVVVWPDHSPATTARAALTVSSTGAHAMRDKGIQADGSFTMFGLADLTYKLRAAAYNESEKLYYRSTVEVPPGQGEVLLILERDGPTPSDTSLFPERILPR